MKMPLLLLEKNYFGEMRYCRDSVKSKRLKNFFFNIKG